MADSGHCTLSELEVHVNNNSGRRGVAVIIANDYEGCSNNYPRLNGTRKDAKAMEETFQYLDFATIVKINITKDEICGLIRAVASCRKYPEGYNCIAVVFAGHGSQNKMIVSSDEKDVNLQVEIINPFDPKNSPFIKDIPKIVLVDACRGELQPRGSHSNTDLRVPTNVLVAYSTMDGHKAYEEGSGGIWMQKLAAKLKVSKKSIGDTLADVNKEISDRGLQEPQIQTGTVNIVLSGDDDDSDVERDHPGHRQARPAARPAARPSPREGDEQVRRLLEEFPDLDATNSLTIDNLPHVRKALIQVSAQWKTIAMRFKITQNATEEIKKMYKRDCDQCLTAVIVKWLQSPCEHSWSDVICAIAARVGGDNPTKAKKVAREYKCYTSSWKAASSIADDVDDTPFSSPGFSSTVEVVEELIDVSPSKVIPIGLILGLSYKRMEICNLEDTHEDKLTQMVEFLLNGQQQKEFDKPSWKKVVIAIAVDDGGGDYSLARKIAAKHPKGIQSRTGVSASHTSPPPVQCRSGQGSLPAENIPVKPVLPSKPSDTFGSSDFAMLQNFLSPLAHKWDHIAVQLGFTYDEIENIRTKMVLIPKAPLSYLQELIGLWLKREPPKFQSYPTKSILIEALKSDSVMELEKAARL